jgi:HSP20 family protein
MTDTATEQRGAGDGPARLARWDPAELFEHLQEEMSRLWTQSWPLGPWTTGRPLRRMAPAPGTWAPRMDVFEKNGKLVIKTELPGVEREDVEVTLEGADLVIKGERRAESGVKEEDYYRLERRRGAFHRSVTLPFEATPEDITAHFARGVLELELPRPALKTPEPKTIAIA